LKRSVLKSVLKAVKVTVLRVEDGSRFHRAGTPVESRNSSGKPIYVFQFAISELFSLALTVEVLQGKCVKTRCLQEGVGHLEPRFQGEGVVPQYM